MAKNILFSQIISKKFLLVSLTAMLVVSGFFAPQQAFAAAIVTPADDSTNISIDTTSGGGTGIFSDLEGPAITENIAGDIAEGTHTITLPSGWEFDASSNITISKFGKIVLGSTSVTPIQTSFSFVVSSQSTSPSVLGFSGLKVRPTGTIPSTGNITYSGDGIAGVDGSTNFGTLTTVPGTITKLAFTTQPGGAEYGSLLDPQPVVRTQDQFGNDSTEGLASSLEVGLTLTGGGALVGDATLDIGTGAGNGTVTFTDLTVDEFGADKQLTASADGLVIAISDNFEIIKKSLTAIITAENKVYDGNNSATITAVELDGILEDDVVVADFSAATATFADENVGDGKTVSALGITIDGVDAGNYSYDGTAAGTANITPATLTVSATGIDKVYDATTGADVDLSDDRISGDILTLGYTAIFTDGKNVGDNKPISITDIAITGGADMNNYTLNGVTTAATTANITPATLTATITVENRTYDGTDDATITGYAHDAFGGDIVELSGGTATFNNANVGDNKPVTAEGIIHSGTDALNYSYDGAATGNADITPLGITGSFTADDKVYDGTAAATILERFLTGVLPGDIGNVVLTGGTAEFADPNVADGITVTASDMELGGSVADNYELTSVDTTTANITKAPLTITADDKDRLYGDANPTLTASYVGFVAGEDESVLDTPVELSTTADVASPVGDYLITALGALDNNYDITHENGTLTVNQAPIKITPDEDQGKIYGDSDEEITYTASGFKNDEDESLFTGALGRESGENAGEYLITQGTLDVGGNYFVDSFFDVFYTIEPRPLTITAVTDTKTYDGTTDSDALPEITDGGLQSDDTADFTQSYDTEDVGDDKTLTATGIVNDGNGGANYTYDFSNMAVGEITPLVITITPDAGQSKVYGQDDPVFTYTNTPNLISPDTFTGALSRDGDENVGTYAYTLGDLTAGGNYLLTLGGIATFEIVKATPVITWENPADIVYGTALSETELNATANIGGTFTYTPASGIVLDEGAGQTLSVTFTPTDAANYNPATSNVFITITPLAITITPTANQNKTYGDADPVFTYTNAPALIDGGFIGALSRADGENVGTYAYTLGDLSAGSNYSLTLVQGTFEITQRQITVTAVPDIKVYDGNTTSDETPTFPEGELQFDDEANFTQSYNTKDVGDDKVLTASGIVNDGNGGANYTYDFFNTAVGEITPLEITVTTHSQTKNFGQPDPQFTYNHNPNLIGSDEFSGVLSRDPGENIGDYEIQQDTLTAGSNYNITYVENYLTIVDVTTPVTTDDVPAGWQTADVTVTLTCDDSVGGDSGCLKVYYTTDGTDPTISSDSVNADGSWQFIISTDGEYTIKYRGEDNADNLEDVKTAANLLQLDTTLPIITNQTPPQGNTTSNTKPTMSANYSDSGSGINANTAIIEVDGEVVPEGFYTKTATGINYTPKNPLSYNYHTVYVEVKDNLDYKATAEWTFQIADVDEVSPTATQWPADNSTNVAIDVNPYIDFSEAMDESTLTSSAIQLRKYDTTVGIDISLAISTNQNGSTRVTMTPLSNLDYNTQYYFWISSTVKDLAENSFGSNWQAGQKDNHEFTTVAEDVPVIAYDIPLSTGWNLISLPLIPTSTDIEDVLADISGNIDVVWYYNAGEQTWSSYKPGEGGNLDSIEDGKGYWVFMNNTDTLIVEGREMPAGGPQTLPAYSVVGNKWNLIGFKSVIGRPVENYITQIGNDDVLSVYKNGNYTRVHPSGIGIMEPGYGYWLYPFSNGYSIVPSD